jgi:hypothetical protein
MRFTQPCPFHRTAGLVLILSLAARDILAQSPLPLGTVTDLGQTACPTGAQGHDPTPPVPPGGSVTCRRISVSGCPGAPALGATVWIVKLSPQAPLAGTIFLHDGRGGTFNFTSGGVDPSSFRHTLESNYESAGFQLVDIAWDSDWENLTPNATSTRVAACRPATVAHWIWSNPLLHNSRRDIGFCGQGHSAGSAAMAYSLAWYGLDGIFDNVMLTAGPVFSRIDCGCDTGIPGGVCSLQQLCPELPLAAMEAKLGYPDVARSWIDGNEGTSTCGTDNTGTNPGDPKWHQDSVLASGANLDYPKTAVSAWYCTSGINNSPAEGSFFVHSVSQILPGQPPQVFCSGTCTWEQIYQATINGVPATTLMAQKMAAACVPRH